MTPFTKVYDRFLSKITDDMYANAELTEAETYAMLKQLLDGAIPFFEFPRVNLYDYDEGESNFNADLSAEEINILATYMVIQWIDQQLASIEIVRMKYSGSDFKLTSQANHLAKLQALKESYTYEGFHLQSLYSRRKPDASGIMTPTLGTIMEE